MRMSYESFVLGSRLLRAYYRYTEDSRRLDIVPELVRSGGQRIPRNTTHYEKHRMFSGIATSLRSHLS